MTHDDERRAEALTRLLADEQKAGSACLDADVVAALAEGRLPEAERTAALAHAADCAECRAWIAETTLSLAEPAPSVARVHRFPWRSAAAAAVLVAVFAGFALYRVSERNAPPTDERLVAAVDELRSSDPAVFDGFRPLSAEERAAPGHSVERGGLAVLRPRGALLDGRPAFSWSAVPGSTRYRLRVRDEDGKVLLERETTETSLPFPADAAPLAPGAAFVSRVTASGAGGESTGSAAARVLSDDERHRYERGLGAIRSRVPERSRAVLAAQWAISFGLVEEARSTLDRSPPEGGWTPVEAETRALITRRLGVEGSDPPR